MELFWVKTTSFSVIVYIHNIVENIYRMKSLFKNVSERSSIICK